MPGLAVATAPDELSVRVSSSLAFAEEILGHRIVVVHDMRRHYGSDCYQARAEMGAKAFREGIARQAGVLSRNPNIVGFELLEPYPVVDEPKLIKVLETKDRNCNINYRGVDTQSEIRSHTEESNTSGFGGSASEVGSGLWFGYLLGDELPEFSKLASEVSWESSEGAVSAIGTYGPRQIEMEFQDINSSRPRRITVGPSVPGTLHDTARQATTIEFVEWDVFAGIECPKTIVKWELGTYTTGKLESRGNFMTLQSVGPAVELTERNGDFFTDVPEGRRVEVYDYPGIDFSWEDGEIVRTVDKVKLASLIGHPFFDRRCGDWS